MRRRITGIAIALLLTVMATGGLAVTFLTDAGGRAAPLCSFIGSGALPIFCSPSDPLPVTTGTPTQATNDPAGFGKLFIDRGQFFTTSFDTAGIFVSDSSAIVLGHGSAGGTVDVYSSTTKGRTWTLVGDNLTIPGAVLDRFLTILNTGTTYLIGVNAGANPGVLRTTTFTSFSAATITNGTVFTLAQQAGTIMAARDTSELCRSINDGISFTCTNHAALGNFNGTRQSLASPSAGVWLAIDSGAPATVARSIDDGASFAAVTTLVNPSSTQGVLCLSATICLAYASQTIARSTDAGATWTTVLSTMPASANILNAAVHFGSGVVAIIVRAGTAGTVGVRSDDFGLTWALLPPVDQTFGSGCTSAASTTTQLFTNGVGDAIALGECGATPDTIVLISQSLGAGAVIVSDEEGDRWDINARGAGGVYQDIGNTAALAPWRSAPVQGVTQLSTTPVTSAANTAAVVTVTGAAGTRVCLRTLALFSSAAGNATLTVSDGATVVLNLGTRGLTTSAAIFDPLVCAATGNNLVVNVGAAGAGVTTTTSVIADRQ